MAILTELKDPRVKDVTVTFVEVTPDLRQAKVHVSIMGDESKQSLVLHGLRSSAGFLQSKLSDRIDTRYTPKIEFVLDQGVKKSIAVTEILNRLAEERAQRDAAGVSIEPRQTGGDDVEASEESGEEDVVADDAGEEVAGDEDDEATEGPSRPG